MTSTIENAAPERIVYTASQPDPPGSARRVAHPTQRPSGMCWYALRVASCAEFRVAERLAWNGIERFLPTWTETSRWSDRSKTITRPLFAGYLFARFDRANATHLLRIPGILQVLGTDELAAIPDDEIEVLRLAVDSPAPFERVPHVAGSSVEVKSGNWAGARGIVERTRGAAFATIRMLIFGRDTPVEIATEDLKAA
jgi:transcriptional antiterminator RfaH